MKPQPSFEEAVSLYWQDMVNMAQHIIKRQPEDAEDAVQQAMLTLVRHKYDPAHGASMKTWMITAVRSRALDYLRDNIGKLDQINQPIPVKRAEVGAVGRRNRAPTLEEIDYGSASASILQYRPGNESFDLKLDIEKALSTLSDEERLIVDMLYTQGFSLPETAFRLGYKGPWFYKYRITPLRRKLKVLLAEHAPSKVETTPASDSTTA